MSPVYTFGSAAYRAAVQLYPPAFRHEFADEMTRDFDQATREAAVHGIRSRVFGLWAHVGIDFLSSLVRQWIRTGLPFALVTAALFSFAGVGLTAQFLVGRSWATPLPAEKDAELLALFVLVIVLLLIIVATICATQFLTRSLLTRRVKRQSSCSRHVV